MIYTVKEGRQFSLPRKPRIYWKPKKLTFIARLYTPYDLEDNDQKDWLKLTGFTFNPFNPSKNAFMCGFRWNTNLRVWEVGNYKNIDGKKIFPIKKFKIKNNTPFELTFVRNSKNWTMYIDGEFVGTYPKTKNLLWRIQPYFGGNRKSPIDFKCQLNEY